MSFKIKLYPWCINICFTLSGIFFGWSLKGANRKSWNQKSCSCLNTAASEPERENSWSPELWGSWQWRAEKWSLDVCEVFKPASCEDTERRLQRLYLSRWLRTSRWTPPTPTRQSRRRCGRRWLHLDRLFSRNQSLWCPPQTRWASSRLCSLTQRIMGKVWPQSRKQLWNRQKLLRCFRHFSEQLGVSHLNKVCYKYRSGCKWNSLMKLKTDCLKMIKFFCNLRCQLAVVQLFLMWVFLIL